MTRPVACLISCVSKKLDRRAFAIDMYTSDLFKKSVKYARSYHLPVYILSAKHGLLKQDKVIEPYDVSLHSMSVECRLNWYRDIAKDIDINFEAKPLLVLAGSIYLGFKPLCSSKIIDPMTGLPIGKRLRFLNEQTRRDVNKTL